MSSSRRDAAGREGVEDRLSCVLNTLAGLPDALASAFAAAPTSDFVLATVQGTGSFYVKNASAGSGKFTIFINKAPTAPATVKVAYFVISAS